MGCRMGCRLSLTGAAKEGLTLGRSGAPAPDQRQDRAKATGTGTGAGARDRGQADLDFRVLSKISDVWLRGLMLLFSDLVPD